MKQLGMMIVLVVILGFMGMVAYQVFSSKALITIAIIGFILYMVFPPGKLKIK